MGPGFWRRACTAAASALALAVILAATASAFDPVYEAKNNSKTQERSRIFMAPDYQVKLREISLQNRADAMQTAANDPERNFLTNLCATGEDGCAGDIRLYDWGPKHYGIVAPV